MRVPLVLRVAAAAVAAGAAIGALVAVAGETSYRAQVTILVGHGSGLPRSSEEARQGARTVAALAVSDSVTTTAAAALKLDRSAVAGSVSARPQGGSGLVVLTVTQPTADRAVRVAQQTALTLSQLVAARVGGGVGATIWDAPHGASAQRPSVALDAGLGAAAALALTLLALGGLRVRRRPRPVAAAPPPPPAAPAPALRPEPVPEPEPLPAAPLPLEPEPSRFSVAALEELVARVPVGVADAAELDAYVAALRGQADERGLLPASLAPMVREVFGTLL